MCWCTPNIRTPFCDNCPWKMAEKLRLLETAVLDGSAYKNGIEQENAKYRKALEHYADPANWANRRMFRSTEVRAVRYSPLSVDVQHGYETAQAALAEKEGE